MGRHKSQQGHGPYEEEHIAHNIGQQKLARSTVQVFITISQASSPLSRHISVSSSQSSRDLGPDSAQHDLTDNAGPFAVHRQQLFLILQEYGGSFVGRWVKLEPICQLPRGNAKVAHVFQ